MAFSVSVPNVPGVPSVNFAPNFGNLAALLISDAVGLFLGVSRTKFWGIYFFGIPVLAADNVVSFDYKKSSAISDFPVEGSGGLLGGLLGGGTSFSSYNKVPIPADARFRFTKGGSSFDKQTFLAVLDTIAGDLNQYDIVTPDAIYIGYNVTQYSYRRVAESGPGLVSVDVATLEVRVAPGISFSNTSSSSDAGQTNDGTVQTTAPSGAQTTTLSGWS